MIDMHLGEVSLSVVFPPPENRVLSKRKNIASIRSNVFPFRVDSFSERA